MSTLQNVSTIELAGSPAADADPLHGFDTNWGAFLDRLPDYNQAGDASAILGGLSLLNANVRLVTPEPGIALRALGDLDMGIGSARRHFDDPVGRIPGLGENLARLCAMAVEIDGGADVPRGTYHTYAHTQDQQRRFTNLDEELVFMSELEKTKLALERSLVGLAAVDFATDGFDVILAALVETRAAVAQMKDSMINVHRAFKPKGKGFFASELRPFFEPVLINGVLWDAPSAASTSWLGIEEMLKNRGNGNVEDKEFYDHNEVYLPVVHRRAIGRFFSNNGQTYLEYISGLPPGEVRSAFEEAYMGIFSEMADFGKIHTKDAFRDFDHRPAGATGGAGYRPEHLDRRHGGRVAVLALLAGHSAE